MLTIKRLKVLVCQIIWFLVATTATWGYTGPDISSPGVQGDALSANPTYSNRSVPAKQFPGKSKSGSSYSSTGTSGTIFTTPGYSGYSPLASPGSTTCGPQGCPVPGMGSGTPAPFPGMFGLFSRSGMGLGSCADNAFLPHIGCKQFQVSAQIWYPTLYRSEVIWGTNLTGGPGFLPYGGIWPFGRSTLSLVDDLGLKRSKSFGVYEGRCQMRYNWGLRFTFMPINYRTNSNPQIPFYFGNQFYYTGVNTLTKWDRYIYRAELVYDWFHKCNAVSSLFAGYMMIDDNLTISQIINPAGYIPSRSRSQLLGLYSTGASIERIIRGIGSATVSVEARGNLQFNYDYFGWDAVGLGRIYMPMNCGRYGYIEGGYRWFVLDTSQPTNYDKTNFGGPTAGIGLIF
ncbi:MAG: hypothetical protein ACP5VS_00740 [Desulfomonilaceae bacterium]